MRVVRCIALSLAFSWLAGCVTSDAPGNSTPPPRTPLSQEYLAKQGKAFEVWQKNLFEGTISAEKIWDCPLCPVMKSRLPGGIWAGSDESDPDRQPNEPPLTSVNIPQPYAIAVHEVTRAEFGAFVAATSRRMKGGCHTDRLDPAADFLNPGFEQHEDHPVVCVSWNDANDYVAWLNSQTSGGYRLPTEAEWHAGGFGGGYEIYFWGDQPEPACHYANVLDVAGAAKHPRDGALGCNDGATYTNAVGRYLPGATMQYDVIGNAAEWTATCDAPDTAGPRCSRAIVRGGSWKSTRAEIRLAARRLVPVDFREHSVGFRVAKTLDDPDRPLKSAAEYLIRGRQQMWQLEFGPAQKDLERAVDMDPKNSHAVSARGWIHFRTEKFDEARRDFAAALTLNQANAEAIAGLGACALVDRNAPEAVRLLDQALALEPDFNTARAMRASANMHARNLDGALADSSDVLRESPTDIELLQLRVHARTARREWPEAAVELHRLTLALPTLASAQQFAALMYSALMLDDRATVAANRALSAWKSSENHLVRANVRPWMDLQGRMADIKAALALEPKSLAALAALGEIESRVGNHDAARRAFTEMLEIDSAGQGRADILILRGIELHKLGDRAAAIRDFEAAAGLRSDARVLNGLCWKLMAAGVALDRAMTYCDGALRMQPRRAAYLDSKATLMLRLGRWKDAISLYDEALALAPNNANSLYGRGIAKQSRCKCAEGSTDLGEASRQMPSIRRNFERMDFATPYPLATSNVDPT